MRCYSCGYQLNDGSDMCTNCGAGQYPSLLMMPVIKSQRADPYLGFLCGFVVLFVPVAGLIVTPLLYCIYKKKYPAFARGLGIAALIPVVLMVLGLGALALCLISAPKW